MLSRDRQRDSPFLLATIAGRAHVGRPVVTPLMSPGMTVGARCFIHWRAHSHNYILRTVVDNCRMLDRNDRVASLAASRRRHGCDASALDDTLCRDFPRKRLAHNDALQAPRRRRRRRDDRHSCSEMFAPPRPTSLAPPVASAPRGMVRQNEG